MCGRQKNVPTKVLTESIPKSVFLTPDPAVLHLHGDADAVVLGSALCQGFLQSHRVQQKPVIEASGNVVHLRREQHVTVKTNRSKQANKTPLGKMKSLGFYMSMIMK